MAEKLGADPSGEAGPVLMQHYAEMASYYRDTEDLSDLCVSEGEGIFRLSARGIAAAKGEG